MKMMVRVLALLSQVDLGVLSGNNTRVASFALPSSLSLQGYLHWDKPLLCPLLFDSSGRTEATQELIMHACNGDMLNEASNITLCMNVCRSTRDKFAKMRNTLGERLKKACEAEPSIALTRSDREAITNSSFQQVLAEARAILEQSADPLASIERLERDM